MRGRSENLTIGERVDFYRRRRGMTQEVLADLVGHSADWVYRVENNRIELDRLSVIRRLAEVLDVSLGDLLGEPTLLDWTPDSGSRTVPALREALMDYQQLTPQLAGPITDDQPVDLGRLRLDVADAFDAYQSSRYGFVTHVTPLLLKRSLHAVAVTEGADQATAHGLLALTYQIAATVSTKLGEADLAWIAAERGLAAAQLADDQLIIGSLFRAVAHALLSNGRFDAAAQLVDLSTRSLTPALASAAPPMWSIYGSLFLTGSMAAARSDDRPASHAFLREAERSATRVGEDANHMWTAFGPTNVAIHRVATAMELGDVQIAADLGPRVDPSPLPVERQARHRMETARAFSAWNRRDDALELLLDAERLAPEQVRHHAMSRNLVTGWIRQQRTPNNQLDALARRLHLV